MRKIDYSILARVLNKELTRPPEDYAYDAEHDGARKAIKRIAWGFAESASVNKAEFLKACGIE